MAATSRRRAAAAAALPRRSVTVATALAVALLLIPAAGASAADGRWVGQVTDALRTPAHKLAAGDDGRALADLVFLDRDADATTYRTCVRRLGRSPLRTCFTAMSGPEDVATVTPLRFQRGRYVVDWTVAGDQVASWRFRVV